MTQDSWEVFTQEDGLVDDVAWQILEDSKGNIWFRTANKGVIKYDGNGWINYSTDQGLVSNKIATIYEDSKGMIWLGSKKGLMRFNGDSFEVISSKNIIDRADGMNLIRIIEDSSGNIWFGSGTLSSFDGENVSMHTSNKNQLPSLFINLFYYDEVKNIMWIGGLGMGPNSGISSFDGEKWQIHKKEPGAPQVQINCIITDDNGILWAGTKKGVYCYDGTSWTNYSVEHGLTPDIVLILHKDSNNKIWATTGKPPSRGVAISALSKSGLNVFYEGEWHTFKEVPGSPNSRVIKIFETSKGEFWFDTFKLGIYRYDGSSWYEFKRKNGFKSNHFTSIYEDSKGNVWFGLGSIGGEGIGKFDGIKWTFFDEDTGLPSNFIISILEDSKGNMWFGSSKGILRYSP
jgi:ligand-binding sensor domain-containing protein